jgi:16S rRNA (cytidine1402-2'-O)-methyltransferase
MAGGKLLLIGTPIGNLGDLSPRALEAIRACSLLLCEDTRHTRKLLNHFGVEKTVESFHEHNETAKADSILDRVAFGEIVGIVSDAGMPVLSDPGFPIVRRARERRLTVEPIPGPFAGAMALIASGIHTLPFTFYGFTPHKQGERREFYRRVRDAATTSVVYESPQRLIASLEDALQILGEVEATVAREMTKIHEELIHGTIPEILRELQSRDLVRGEITIVFAAPQQSRPTAGREEIASEFRRLRDEGVRRSDAVKLLAERYGFSRNELYQVLLGEDSE